MAGPEVPVVPAAESAPGHDAPRFVVVGHPNKGKSSIVATLAQDASVAIADESGTTRRSASYPMRVDSRVLYELVDTPGFQRPARALADLRSRATSAGERPGAVSAFVAAHTAGGGFPDECELLAPIIDGRGAGAGVLYVVDGSVPYGPEYEAEMEILRWSGRPRMALINPIGTRTDHLEEWRAALGQYFSMVRVFDAVTAEFEKQIELLRAFGELHEPWRPVMDVAIDALRQRREQQLDRSARAIARMLRDAVTHVEVARIPIEENAEPAKARLVDRFVNRVREIESEGRQAIERLYGHPAHGRREPALDLIEVDLFAVETQRVFGLTRAQAAQAGAAGGAGAGLLVDMVAAGVLLGAAAIAGGAAGAAAAWFGFDRVARVRVLAYRRLGVKEIRVGPLDNPSVCHALAARALAHHAIVRARTHAVRDAIEVGVPGGDVPDTLDATDSRALYRVFKTLAGSLDDERSLEDGQDRLEALIAPLVRARA